MLYGIKYEKRSFCGRTITLSKMIRLSSLCECFMGQLIENQRKYASMLRRGQKQFAESHPSAFNNSQ